jgi:hypothetical protein
MRDRLQMERVMKSRTLTNKEFEEEGHSIVFELMGEAHDELRRRNVDSADDHRSHVYDSAIGKEIVVEVFYTKQG